jgi:hypothetical protein
MRLLTFAMLVLAVPLYAQTPVALHTSDPKFTPRWLAVPSPVRPLKLERRWAGYADGKRPAGTFEIAYCLVDEQWAVSPVSAVVTVTATTTDWECVGTTPGVPLWTRAAGVMWVYRQAGTKTWYPFACDENRPHSWLALKPFKPIVGWHNEVGGHKLFPVGIGFGSLDDYPRSATLTTGPPAPSVRLLECQNRDYDIAYTWVCNQGETALSPVTPVPTVPGAPAVVFTTIPGPSASRHAPFQVVRQMPGSPCQPPQGAIGMHVYLRKSGGQWHRQPCPDGHTGYLWALDVVTLPINQFVESGVRPMSDFGPAMGRSYLSSLHLALRDWGRDVIVDNDQVICCPLISEWNGATWDYQPRNHWLAVYSTTTGAGTWTLTVDGVTTPPMPRTNHTSYNTVLAQWRSALDATFGPGNVLVSDYWPNYAPKIELAGKWAASDMTGRVSVQVFSAGAGVAAVDPGIVGSQTGQGWVMSESQTKFKRKISTSNAGNWRVTDAAATPDGITGYPMGWPLWLECSQRTKLVGCDFLLAQSNCGIATCDNSGGGCFHFNPVECSIAPLPANTRPVTFGIRCVNSSSFGWNGHICSELIGEKCHIQAKFPVVCEGIQAANWQFRDATCVSDGSFDSAIVTISNAGTLLLGGRFTCDSARSMIASVWAKQVTVEHLWIDGGMPSLMACNANSWTILSLAGGKINQWESWLHAIESPAGSVEAYTSKLVTDSLDSQHNGAVKAILSTPKPGQLIYAPRVITEVPSLLQSLIGPIVLP